MRFDRDTYFRGHRGSIPRDVFPCSTFADAVNRLFTNAVFATERGKSRTTFKFPEYFAHLLRGQLRRIYALAPCTGFRMSVPPVPSTHGGTAFSDGIQNVIKPSTEEEVVRVDARRIIAAMADFKRSRINAVVEVVRNAGRSIRSVVQFESPISLPVFVASPVPTLCRTQNLIFRMEANLGGTGNTCQPRGSYEAFAAAIGQNPISILIDPFTVYMRCAGLAMMGGSVSPITSYVKLRERLFDIAPRTKFVVNKFSQGVNLLRQGLALVRLVRLRKQASEPFVF